MWGYGSRYDATDISGIIQTAVNHGVSVFDTAETYADGLAETLLGGALKQLPRESFAIVSKVSPANLRYEDVLKAAYRSIERMELQYIDLYLVHYPNLLVRMRDTFSALEHLVATGKVRYIGVSNFGPPLLKMAQESCKREEIIADEIEYNVLARQSERQTIPYCIKNKIGVICYSPLAGGVLSGRYGPGNPPRDRARAFNFCARPSFVDQMGPLLSVLSEIAQTKKASIAQVALSWVVCHQSCIAIPASLNPGEASANAQAAEINLSQNELRLISSAAPTQSLITHLLDHFAVRPMAWAKVALLGSQAMTQ
jgi:myo-inositol catabolism protein IolS